MLGSFYCGPPPALPPTDPLNTSNSYPKCHLLVFAMKSKLPQKALLPPPESPLHRADVKGWAGQALIQNVCRSKEGT